MKKFVKFEFSIYDLQQPDTFSRLYTKNAISAETPRQCKKNNHVEFNKRLQNKAVNINLISAEFCIPSVPSLSFLFFSLLSC